MKSCLNVFDPKTELWDHVTVSCLEANSEVFYNSKSVSIDGKFHVQTGLEVVVAYSPKDGKWNFVGVDAMRQFVLDSDSDGLIGNVLYSVFDGFVMWYDTKVNKWRNLKGLEVLPEFPYHVRLADYGGKMVVLWGECAHDDSEKVIWCAEIELVRREKCETWGLVKWFDHVLTLPIGYDFVNALAATV